MPATKSNVASLRNLSDADLLTRMIRLARVERAATLDVVRHIAEFDRRKLYLDVGFSTTFDYCTRHLGFSDSAAGRRIAAARLLRRFPVIADMLADGSITLCGLSLLRKPLEDDNNAGLLTRVRGKSYREVAAIVAEYNPRPAPRDRVRPICVSVRETPLAPVSPAGAGSGHHGIAINGQPGAYADSTPNVGSGNAGDCAAAPLPANDAARQLGDSLAPAANVSAKAPVQMQTKHLIQFAADPALMKQVEEVRALLSHKLGPNASLESVFAAGLEALLDKHSPARRDARRRQRKESCRARGERTRTSLEGKRVSDVSNESDVPEGSDASNGSDASKGNGGTATGVTRAREARSTPNVGSGKKKQATAGGGSDVGSSAESTPNVGSGKRRREHIPASVRDAVFRRDGGRCTYTSSDGNRCGARSTLEIDHIVPVARGGSTAPSNLRLLCSAHNKREAERAMGADVMKRHWRRE